MKTTILWIGLAGLLSLTACTKNAGNLITQDREVGTFTGIELKSAGDIIITDATDYEVRIEAGDNLMPYIKTTVDGDGVLSIWESKNFIWHNRRVTIYISATYLNEIIIQGSGDFRADNLESDELFVEISGSGDIGITDLDADLVYIKVSGSGDIDLAGNVDEVNAKISGSGDIDARSLITKMADVRISGSGNIRVFASEALYAEISGSGEIFYYGNPSIVQTNVSGSGTIIKR